MYSIRGAITVENDNKEEIFKATKELFQRIIESNNVDIDDIVSIVFSATNDLKSAYPAEAVREMGVKFASLMCLQEMNVENSLPKCIRVMVLVNGDKKQNQVKNIYLKDAVNLRPEFAEGN